MSLKKTLLTALPLAVFVAALNALVLVQPRPAADRDVGSAARLAPERATHEKSRARPRSISERFQEEMESASRGSLSEEASRERDLYEAWFFGQRTYPLKALPQDAVGKAVRHAKVRNVDLLTAFGFGPEWKALGPTTIPDGQTDTTAGQSSPVSGRVTAIAVDPTNPSVVYAAGAQGGVWKTTNASDPAPTWVALTDHEASLAVGAIAIDPVNPDIVYVGTGEPNRSCDSYYGQGVLRSADGGDTWTLLGGGGSPLLNPGPFTGKSVARILIDPSTAGTTSSTTVWASTTIGAFSGGTIPTCQTPSGVPFGLWRSTDSGTTWQLQNVPAPGAGSFSVQDMVIDPTNPNVLYAAVRSNGVWKSTNAKAPGATFAKMANGFANSANGLLRRISLTIGGPSAPGTLYASVENLAGSALFGLYKTTTAGATWANVDAGFHGTAIVKADSPKVRRLSGPSFVTDGTWIGRRFIIDNFNARTIRDVTDGDHLVLSSDAGIESGAAFYSVGNYPRYCDGQCFYDMTVAVDPAHADADRVYVGGNPHNFSPNLAPNLSEAPCNVFLERCPVHFNWRSDDGGLTWSSISQGDGAGPSLHTDDHAYAFDASSTVYDGNDGGIWRSTDHGFSWTSMNTNITITQFQGLSLHPTDTEIVLGGTQDNGTNIHNPALVAPPKWFHSDFGDGGTSLIDQSSPSTMFHTYFNQSFNFMGPARTDNGGQDGPGSWPFVGAYFGYGPDYYNGMDPTDPVSFYAPMAQHPAFTPNVVYFGSNKVYRSPNPLPTLAKIPSWTRVSRVLTKGGAAYLSWIGVLPQVLAGKEVLYTGASDGRVMVSSNVDGGGLAKWAIIDKPPLPNRAVTEVLPAPGDPTGNTAYATFSGFNGATPTTPGHVFTTTNGLGLATWTDISGDLPDIPVNQIAIDERNNRTTLYVGTDIGVFGSRDGGVHWKHLTNGLPNVSVFALLLNHQTGRLVASTHGRGMFELVTNEP